MHEQPLKPFRWVGRPSEEELLGIPFPVPPGGRPDELRRRVTPPRRSAAPPPPASRRRLRPGEVIALLAAAAVAGLALGGAGNGVRFSAAQPLAPAASDPDPARVTVAGEGTVARPGPNRIRRAAAGSRQTSRGATEDDKKKHAVPDKPGDSPTEEPAPTDSPGPEEPAREPILEADLPLLGKVTVEEPEETDPVTELADELLPIATVALP